MHRLLAAFLATHSASIVALGSFMSVPDVCMYYICFYSCVCACMCLPLVEGRFIMLPLPSCLLSDSLKRLLLCHSIHIWVWLQSPLSWHKKVGRRHYSSSRRWMCGSGGGSGQRVFPGPPRPPLVHFSAGVVVAVMRGGASLLSPVANPVTLQSCSHTRKKGKETTRGSGERGRGVSLERK